MTCAITSITVPTTSQIANIFHMKRIQRSYGMLQALMMPMSAVEVGRM